MGGITILPYDSRWPAGFDVERARIAGALTDLAPEVEHIGSTAVPGLSAKPILDILIGLPRYSDSPRCIAPLVVLGYESRGEAGIPGRLYFRKSKGRVRTHHVHAVEFDGPLWRRHLLFRDALRQDAALAAEYARLKASLAQRFPHDREAYTNAKAPFVEGVLGQVQGDRL